MPDSETVNQEMIAGITREEYERRKKLISRRFSSGILDEPLELNIVPLASCKKCYGTGLCGTVTSGEDIGKKLACGCLESQSQAYFQSEFERRFEALKSDNEGASSIRKFGYGGVSGEFREAYDKAFQDLIAKL